jgi:hypothetical protein
VLQFFLTLVSSSSSSSPSQIITDWIVGYKLLEPCGYSNIKNSPTIKLITEVDEHTQAKQITDFLIRVDNESSAEEAIRKANPQAKRLVDIMTFRYEKSIRYYYNGINKKIVGSNPERWTVETQLTIINQHLKGIDLDLTDNAIVQMIQKDDDINHRLHHASLAREAEELKIFAIMFTELFQVIEGEKNRVGKDYDKYKALRDALSHRVLDPNRPAMIGIKTHYPPNTFEFTPFTQLQPSAPRYEFNYNSDKNMKVLEAEAKKLKGDAMSYLSTRI